MEKTISVISAVKLSGYTRQQIYNLLRDRKIKATRRGWEYWIDRHSLATYCEQQGRGLTESA